MFSVDMGSHSKNNSVTATHYVVRMNTPLHGKGNELLAMIFNEIVKCGGDVHVLPKYGYGVSYQRRAVQIVREDTEDVYPPRYVVIASPSLEHARQLGKKLKISNETAPLWPMCIETGTAEISDDGFLLNFTTDEAPLAISLPTTYNVQQEDFNKEFPSLLGAEKHLSDALLTIGRTMREMGGACNAQEVDLQALYKDVASDYLVEVNVSSQLPNALDRAMRTAITRRAPTALIIPSDLQEEPYEPPAHAFKQVPSSDPSIVSPMLAPRPDQVSQAAEILNAGEKVAILIGQGARGAADQVRQVAELTGAGVAKALLGKDVLPDDVPYVTGAIGLLGTRPSYEMMMGCDTLLIVGSNFPYTQFMPQFGQARAIHIDIDGTLIGMRYPTELNMVADAATATTVGVLAAGAAGAAALL